jgi:3-hydroxybutyryl-CoA dehydrogenase
MRMSQIKTIVVCGAGTMGSGIAQVAAQSGFNTIQFDLNKAILAQSELLIQTQLAKLVEKERLVETEKKSILERIQFTDQLANCKADLVIEAIVEKKDSKIALFNQLAAINSEATIYATNTSSISINEIANGFNRPTQFIGMHFFNPAPIMKLVEIIKGDQTNPQVLADVEQIVLRMGKTPVICKDAPGFIVNRVARHFYLEAMQMVSDGNASIEQVDAVLEAAGFKMGPFKLMDLIGMDINYSVSNIVWEALGKPVRLKPAHLQKEKVDSGHLGKKTGKGFYSYEKKL